MGTDEMIHLVTGVAGFVGSHLAEALVERGERVRGVDCFTPYYDRRLKEGNVTALLDSQRFTLHEVDLRTDDLSPLLDGVGVVHHQAAEPGVRRSWTSGFDTYERCNITATQRLLEAVRRADRPPRIVLASSSSVYGNARHFPVRETDLPAPHSPYGVTKLAAEHLCGLYAANHGVDAISLRYFTVYGPRQRPDMAHHRLIEAALDQTPFPLYGDGSHVRDFTFVGDVVRANLLAATAEVDPATVVNICAGGSTVMRDLIEAVGDAVGKAVPVDQQPEQPGDVRRTGGSNELARTLLGWTPETTLADGIAQQVDWHRRRRS
jgi:UDP-glucuronate 4-epimerase